MLDTQLRKVNARLHDGVHAGFAVAGFDSSADGTERGIEQALEQSDMVLLQR